VNEEKKVIKILVVMSSPVIMKRKSDDKPIEKVPPIFIEDEWNALKEAVQGIDVRLERCYPPTLNRLDDMLHLAASPKRKEPYEIVHFSGHGEIGTLLFEDGNLAGINVDADRVGELFEKTGVKVVILSACFSGKDDPNASVLSPATLLAETYVPAVIYTNNWIRVDVAKEFTATLYNRMSTGWTVVESFEAAQRQIENHPELRGAQKTVFEYKCSDDFALDGTPVESCIINAVPPHEPRLFENPYFFGREQELAEISALMGAKSDKVITITGIGGSGKTVLAKELARRNAWRYPGGLVWADFRDAGAASPGTILDAVQKQLNVEVSEPAKYEEGIIARLREASCLVVCDNVETVAVAARGKSETDRETANKLIDLITNLPPNVQVLCTGRETLGVKAEQVKRIIGLDPVAAALYFLEVAQDKGRKVKVIDNKTENAVFSIVEAVSWIPLAVYLAASAYADSTMSLDELRQGLEETSGKILVDDGMTGADRERHRSIKASIKYSLALLESEAARELFPKLGVFSPGAGFDDEAVENVCGVNDWENGLRELVRKSLVERYKVEGVELEGSKDYFRYILFPPVAEHATNMADGGKRLEKPFTHFYLKRCYPAHQLIEEGKNIQLGIIALEIEHGNLTHALEISYENDWDDKIAWFLDILSMLYGNKFASRELMTLLKRAMEYYHNKKAQLEVAGLYQNLGVLSQDLFEYDAATVYYEQSKEIFEELDDKKGLAYTLHQMAVTTHLKKEYDEAMEYCNEAFDVFDDIGTDTNKEKAAVLHQMGMTASKQKEYDEAMGYYERSKELNEETGNKFGMAATLHQMGRAAAEQGHYEEAMRYYQQSLKTKSEIGDKENYTITMGAIGDLYRAQSETANAIAAYLRAMLLAQEIGFENAFFGALKDMYDCYVEVGDDGFKKHFAAAARALKMPDEEVQNTLEEVYIMFEVIAEALPSEEEEETG